jgi:hypothetical protein
MRTQARCQKRGTKTAPRIKKFSSAEVEKLLSEADLSLQWKSRDYKTIKISGTGIINDWSAS